MWLVDWFLDVFGHNQVITTIPSIPHTIEGNGNVSIYYDKTFVANLQAAEPGFQSQQFNYQTSSDPQVEVVEVTSDPQVEVVQ